MLLFYACCFISRKMVNPQTSYSKNSPANWLAIANKWEKLCCNHPSSTTISLNFISIYVWVIIMLANFTFTSSSQIIHTKLGPLSLSPSSILQIHSSVPLLYFYPLKSKVLLQSILLNNKLVASTSWSNKKTSSLDMVHSPTIQHYLPTIVRTGLLILLKFTKSV